jgi:transcriptional regulator with XRE-family HTH domain
MSVSDLIDIHIGKRLRWRRRAVGLTQGDLANRIGVRFQQIQKYECAANRTSAAILWKLACALEVRVSYFYEGLAGAAPSDGLPSAIEQQALAANQAAAQRPSERAGA